MPTARPRLRDVVRIIPDTVRLLRALTVDTTIPRTTRWLVWALVGYLVSPIDLIPDFVPVIGYADDVLVITFVLRHVIRTAGPDKLREHWSGNDDGLATLQRLLRLHESG